MKTIGTAARESGISAKMIRHYDSIGLVRPSARSEAGYRYYNEADLHTLRFVGRARSLGFSIGHTRRLLALWRDRRRASAAVKSLALAQVAELDRKIAELGEMRRAHSHLARHCEGDDRPDCPILDGLSAGATASADLPATPPATRREAAPRTPHPRHGTVIPPGD